MDNILLIQQCKAKEPAALQTLYESYMPYVLTIVRRFGILEQDMPDVMQEIFIAVFSNLERFDTNKGSLKSWIQSIAVHKILNINRKTKRARIVELDTTVTEALVATIDLDEMDSEYLVELISELPDGYRTVFNLYVVDGYSHKEIAVSLGIDTASSRSQLSRAKQLLKKRILKLQQQAKRYYGTI